MFADLEDYDCNRGKWTKEEDEMLRHAVQELGDKRWKLISERVIFRSPIQCLHRWTKILKPGLVKGPWTHQEDSQVLLWVQAHGPKNWSQCAEIVGGRSGKQCRERWNNALDPSLKKGEWTPVEDSIIFAEYRSRGPKWTEIAKLLPGRSENSIKNRFYSTLRKVKPRDSEVVSALPEIGEKGESRSSLQLKTLLSKLQRLETLMTETTRQITSLEESIGQEGRVELEHFFAQGVSLE